MLKKRFSFYFSKSKLCVPRFIYYKFIFIFYRKLFAWQNSLFTGLNQPRKNKLLTIFRGEVTSASIAADFQAGPLYWSN